MDEKLLKLFSEEELDEIKREAEKEAQEAIELLKKQELEKAKILAKKRAREQIKKYYKEQIISAYKADSAKRVEDMATKLVNDTLEGMQTQIENLQKQINDLQQNLIGIKEAGESKKADETVEEDVPEEKKAQDAILKNMGVDKEERKEILENLRGDETYEELLDYSNDDFVELGKQYNTDVVDPTEGIVDFTNSDFFL